MALDLHRAFVKKQENECARLDEFNFRRRARALRLLAEALPGRVDPALVPASADLVARIAIDDDETILADLAIRLTTAEGPFTRLALRRLYERVREQAHLQLVEELGDPTPHALA